MRLTVVGISATSNVVAVDARDGQAHAVERDRALGHDELHQFARRLERRAATRCSSATWSTSTRGAVDVARTKWPSMRSPTRSARSTCTLSPAWSRPRFVFASVSGIDVEPELARADLRDGQAHAVDGDALAVPHVGPVDGEVSRRNFGAVATAATRTDRSTMPVNIG